MSSRSTLHELPGDVETDTGNLHGLAHRFAMNRPSVKAQSHSWGGYLRQGRSKFERGTRRTLGGIKKHRGHVVLKGQKDGIPFALASLELGRPPDRLNQPLREPLLFFRC